MKLGRILRIRQLPGQEQICHLFKAIPPFRVSVRNAGPRCHSRGRGFPGTA
ncbi:MAG: hypothetical protein MZV64_71080 [Ignavibacteriales bacterium]|nr:hypothetical protein [Ignavibacteriales bacterium]